MLSLIRRGDMSTAVYQLQTVMGQCGMRVATTGSFDAETEKTLMALQRKLGLTPDGIAGPMVIHALRMDMRPTSLRDSDYESAAKRIRCDPRTLKAFGIAEAPRGGFQSDGRPVILYERHYFDRYYPTVPRNGMSTAQLVAQREQIRASNRDICWPSQLSFKTTYKNGSPIPAGERYGSSAQQYSRLDRARRFSDTVALMSASWGKFQIMGENSQRCGWTSVQAFVRAMEASERDHLDAMVSFLYTKKGLVDAVCSNNWREMARLYNGTGQVDYYAPRIKAAFDKL